MSSPPDPPRVRVRVTEPRRWLAAILLLASSASLSALPAPPPDVAPKLEAVGPLTDAAVPAAVRESVEAKGVEVTLPDGPWCRLWLRKAIPEGKSPASGSLHRELAFSTQVGVIQFLREAGDFRGQAVAPGLYALRYATLPEDGNHLGVSEYPDFLLLVPVSGDPDFGKPLERTELFAASARAAGTKHPAVLSLRPALEGAAPKAVVDDRGHVVLEVKATLASGKEVPIVVLVKGKAEE